MRKMIFRQCQGPASPLRSAATKRFSKELLLGTERVTLVAMRGRRWWFVQEQDDATVDHGQFCDGKAAEKDEKLASKASNAKSLEARSMAIDAKCSPEVRRAFRALPVERCGCATIQAVWSACDTFWEFDTAHSGAITREGYINLMRECATVNTLRMLRRARLEFRFRRSAAPVLLEDFLLMIWPKATSEDRARMMRWAELREAPWTCKAWRKLKGIRTSKHQILGYMDTHTHT
ncbi:unnamed protein product [Cladocopium goreaui]|uniref:EF-hand domain-containing protein n=1 Tax=Cladocopium goreaui TaxID=2562237 RepID=A0A9P1GL11_9DINO|nr:unnamed protein product [Cladocopium goreaui]